MALARAAPELLEERARALDAVTAELAPQLLRSMADEERSDDAAHGEGLTGSMYGLPEEIVVPSMRGGRRSVTFVPHA